MSDKKEYAAPAHPPSGDGETRPLPEGWTKQYDTSSKAWFYIDTKASPPRSIWVHPFDDPGYLEKHPEAKSYNEPTSYQPPSSPPPIPSNSHPDLNKGKGKTPEKRGFLGKLKDKAIGSKEEREAAKRLREQERQERLARQQAHAAQYGAPPQVYQQYPGGGYQQGQHMQQGYGQPMHGQPMYVQQQPQRSGFGGGGMALPLVGGLAGGLLLGEALGGDGFGGDGGGDFGGGGGDFGGGGGDFGGGGF